MRRRVGKKLAIIIEFILNLTVRHMKRAKTFPQALSSVMSIKM